MRHCPTLKVGASAVGTGLEEPEGVGVPLLLVVDAAPILYDCEIAVVEKKDFAAANIFSSASTGL